MDREARQALVQGVLQSKVHIRGSLIAALDQGALSISNFVAGALFIKLASTEEYGLYVALTSALFLFSSFQNAVVTTPMTVLLPRIEQAKRNAFAASLFAGQFASLFLLGMVALPLFPTLVDAMLEVKPPVILGVIFGLSTLAFLSREFLRSSFYVDLKPFKALILDGVYALAFVLLLYLLVLGGSLSAQSGMLMIGLSAAIACGAATKRWKTMFRDGVDLKSTFTQTWQFSKWALIGVLASWLQQNTFIYLASIAQGASGVAAVAAARLFVVPSSLIVTGWGVYIRPVMSHAAGIEGKPKLLSLVKWGTIGLMIFMIFYTVILFFLYSWLSPSILPAAYQDIGIYILLWGAVGLIDVFYSNLSNALQSLLLFRALSIIGIVAMVVSVFLGAYLSHVYGSVGFLYGVAISNIVLVLLGSVIISKG
jgi:O-antigen/teichoic acid export membrane protein